MLQGTKYRCHGPPNLAYYFISTFSTQRVINSVNRLCSRLCLYKRQHRVLICVPDRPPFAVCPSSLVHFWLARSKLTGPARLHPLQWRAAEWRHLTNAVKTYGTTNLRCTFDGSSYQKYPFLLLSTIRTSMTSIFSSGAKRFGTSEAFSRLSMSSRKTSSLNCESVIRNTVGLLEPPAFFSRFCTGKFVNSLQQILSFELIDSSRLARYALI